MNKSAIFILFLFGLCWGLYNTAKKHSLSSRDFEVSNVRSKPSSEDYRAKALPLNYRDSMLMRIEIGQLTYFTGEVIQALNRTDFLVGTKKFEWGGGYLENHVFVKFSRPCEILEGDIVKFSGRYDGLLTYNALLGNSVEVPKFTGDYYLIIVKKE